MSDDKMRQNADHTVAINAPPIVVIAEDWATSQSQARNTRMVVFACAVAGVIAFLAPRQINSDAVSAAATTPPTAQTPAMVASAWADVRPAPAGAFSVSPVPDAVATFEVRGVRVRALSPAEVRAADIGGASNAWIVANIAPSVHALAVNDIILGQCNSSIDAEAGEAAKRLPICFVRGGQIYATLL